MRTFEGIDARSAAPLRIQVDNGVIDSVDALAPFGNRWESLPFICPGFIDVQLNGYAGIDYSTGPLRVANIERLIRAVAASGTVRHLATVITGPREQIVARCRSIVSATHESKLVRTAIAGIHVEGPFISRKTGRAAPTTVGTFGIPTTTSSGSGGRSRRDDPVVTVAPERSGAFSFIERVARDGVVVAIGHTAASPE